jgi:hypothetical protein
MWERAEGNNRLTTRDPQKATSVYRKAGLANLRLTSKDERALPSKV